MTRFIQYFPFLVAVMFASTAGAWGAKGHQIVSHVGADLAQQGRAFWQSNLEPIRVLSTVPDRIWKSSTTRSQEEPMHYFEIDTYYSQSEFDQIQDFPSSYIEAIQQYTESRVVEHGTAPWRIRQLYRLALNSLRKGDMKKALQFAGTMSHYIADLSQPLHVTENYDGQMTGNKGIHKFFETDIIKNEVQIRADVKKRAEKLLRNPAFAQQANLNLMTVILQEVERSISLQKNVLEIDDRLGRNSKGAAAQLNLAKDRMAEGAAIFSIVLGRLWQDSGLVAKATPLTIKDPSWIRPDFNQLSFTTRNASMHGDQGYVDCE